MKGGSHLGLVEAAGLGRLDLVKFFFDTASRPGPEITRDMLYQALCFACYGGDEEVATFLLDHGAELVGRDVDRQTALHHAAMAGNPGMVELLLARGAPLEVRNVYGGTVLDQTLWSAGHGGDPDDFMRILETLLAAGRGSRSGIHP